MKKSELIEKALEILENDNEIYVNCVDELDRWDGFADGFKCYPMSELDDLYYGCKVSQFLEEVDVNNFDLSDTYVVFTIYGLQSTNDIYEVYESNTYSGEILDNLIENYNHLNLTWIDSELDDIVSQLFNEDYDD